MAHPQKSLKPVDSDPNVGNGRALAGMIGSCKGNFPRNMQEKKGRLTKPLLRGVLPERDGCLKNRRFDKYARHLPYFY